MNIHWFLIPGSTLLIMWVSFFCWHHFNLDSYAWYGFPLIATIWIVTALVPTYQILRLVKKDLKKSDEEFKKRLENSGK
jgi:hypothetical protein